MTRNYVLSLEEIQKSTKQVLQKIENNYDHPADYLFEKIPEYVKQHGRWINIRRAFVALLHHQYESPDPLPHRIADIDICCLSIALQRHRERGNVEKWAIGTWYWTGGMPEK